MIPDFFSAIQGQLTKELPFVVYRKPGAAVTTAIFQEDDKLNVIQDFSESGFVFAPFNTENPSYFLKPDRVINDSSFYTSEAIKSKRQEDFDSQARELHIKLVERAIDEIKKGAFEKVVLSRSIEVACEISALDLFKLLVTRYDSALCYLWYHPKVGMWLGATPEILLRIDDNRLITMSLAGTKNYREGDDPDWGDKEREEQQLVTDYIKSALEGFVDGLEISEAKSVRAGNLWHLRTRLSGSMKNDLPQVIEALHPTPAVCGLPMSAAKEFILDHEEHRRQFYTGFLGELNFAAEKDRASNNKTELFVNLRCLRLENQRATIYVGGGVTKDSIPESEWQETVAKSHTMLDLLNN